ncbi:MAG: VOC family protein [Gemmatimonadaceae bacterium]|nr:VOC family protein [Gemmatimonadaceae bacterium]
MSASPAPTPVRHVAINADDTTRAQAFYGSVFGWTFNAWGPPGFWMIDTGSREPGAPMAALQQRRTLVEGERMTGFECTIATPDIRATERAILAAGGTILMPRTTIPGVGHLLWFRDTEGNVAGAMQYDSGARVED